MLRISKISPLFSLTLALACSSEDAAQTGPSGGETSTGDLQTGTSGTGAATDSDSMSSGESPTTSGSSSSSSSGSTSSGVSSSGEPPAACEDDPIARVGGAATPIEGFEFRNAFDPSDRNVYDPSDAAALPGPLMVDAWGNRARGAHGTLGVFPPGFVAPLHTHSGAYDGVVLQGTMSNPFGTELAVNLDEDPENNHGTTLLGPGSYWHVPAGSQHTTTCVGPEVCWFYFHAEDAFDFAPIVDENGELVRGVELEPPHRDAAQRPAEAFEFAGEPGGFVQFSGAWGDMAADAHGTFGLFDAGATAPVHVHGADYYGVVISGELTNPFDFEAPTTILETGGYWEVPADSVHTTGCLDGEDCLFYFHAREGFDFTPLCDQEPG